MLKRITAILLSLTLLVSVVVLAEDTAVEEEIVARFTDVPLDHPSYAAIEYLAVQGAISGKTKTEFYPDDFLKREELAKIASASFALAESEKAQIFTDVLAGTWYAPYVQKISAAGYMQGVDSGAFGVGQTLTRQELAVIIKRYLDAQKLKFSNEVLSLYADDDKIAPYAVDAVRALSSLDIMPARANNMWEPAAPATRAETAVAITNAMDAKRKQAASLGKWGDKSQYGPPYEAITGDRLAENMPVPFDVNSMDKQLLALEDLEDGDYGRLKKGSSKNGSIINEAGAGYNNSNGCILVDGEGNFVFSYKAEPGELNAGDYVAFTCMIKAEGVDGGSTSKAFRPIPQVYDDQPKWLAEGNTTRKYQDTDWVEITNIIMIPEKVNALTVPEFYSVNLNCNVGAITAGKIYFDDLRLYKLKFHPMDVVFMDPIYKGIVKGEGGVGDISLRAYVNEGNGAYDLSTMNFTARITDEDHNVLLESTSSTVKAVMDAHFSSATLPMGGDYWAECILTDKETGKVIQKQEYGVHKRPADFTTVMDIDKYGRVTRKGVPYFPISMYNFGGFWEELLTSEGVDDMMNPIYWPLNFPNNDVQGFMKRLSETGTTATIIPGALCINNITNAELKPWIKEQTDIRVYLERLVNNLKDLDQAAFYYIADEVNAMRYGHEIAWERQIIECSDLDHPTTTAIDNTLSYRKGVYAKTADILGYDPYPVTGKDSQSIQKVYNTIAEAKRINPNRPLELFPQMFWYSKRGDLRAPTLEEFRNMCFQGILAGVCMFNVYCYGDIRRNPTPGKTHEEMWAEYEQVLREIKILEPIILSTLPNPYYEVQGGNLLATMSRRHDGKSYLFTVNMDKKDNNAKIYLDGVKKIKGMFSKQVYEADKDGFFEIEWSKYETEVFEYEQADYKSSHADIRNFVAANYTVYDAESEVPTIIIDDDTTEIEYRAYISDYASLYINENKVEEFGKISIDGLNEIKLKVVSEDGRFTTEKTYRIEREGAAE